MKKIQEEQIYHKEKFSGAIIAGLIMLFLVLSAGRIFMANRLVESSDKLRKLDAQITQAENQNQNLSEELRRLESSEVIKQKATAAGFVQNSHFAVLTTTPPVAYRLSP